MRGLLTALGAAVFLLSLGCSSGGEIRYAKRNDPGREGAWIKDPEATATTRDRWSRVDTTRTDSNRVDIPVYEFAQFKVTTRGGAVTRHSGSLSRAYVLGYAAIRFREFVDSVTHEEHLNLRLSHERYLARKSTTRWPGLLIEEGLRHHTRANSTRAFTSEDQPWTNRATGRYTGSASNAWVEGRMSETVARGLRTRSGLSHASASRMVGLHIWKYADRELVTDTVVITYSIIYYNTNEFDTGPTEIDEPVPYYTDYIKDSATLPKEGTSVVYLKREGARDILRWSFPKGIKAGETNKMTYKVKVDLKTKYSNRPTEHRPRPESRD